MIQPGDALPTVQKEVTKAAIARYAEASGDYNPLHVDEEFARKTPFGGIIAHGFLTLGYVSQMMIDVFGEGWIRGGALQVKFLAPVKPGEIVETSGRVTDIFEENGQKVYVCDISCKNQRGENVLVGGARARSFTRGAA